VFFSVFVPNSAAAWLMSLAIVFLRCRFYTAEIAIGLFYLHSQHVIFRYDVDPHEQFILFFCVFFLSAVQNLILTFDDLSFEKQRINILDLVLKSRSHSS